jgi:signal peptidase I
MRRHVVGSAVAFGLFAVIVVAAVVVIAAGGGHKDYRVASAAMEPALRVHARVVANTKAYDKAGPRVGDIVVFHPPSAVDADGDEQCGVVRREDEPCAKPAPGLSRQAFIKRVVAVGPASVAISDGHTVLGGRKAAEPYIQRCGADAAGICDMPRAIAVPKGMVFLLGDNRGNSDDSRFWGPVPAGALIGQVERCGFLSLSCHAVR